MNGSTIEEISKCLMGQSGRNEMEPAVEIKCTNCFVLLANVELEDMDATITYDVKCPVCAFSRKGVIESRKFEGMD